MARQHSSAFFFSSLSQPQRVKFSEIEDGLPPLMSRQDVYWGGEPMEITDSNGSTNSNMSRGSYVSTTTASSPITTYGSYDTNSYMAGFNQPSSILAEGLYAAGGIDNSLQQMYLKTEAQESKMSSGTTVHTPSTLGWILNKDPIELYLCVVPKNKKAPYLQLRAEFVADDITPFYVHLDEPINCPEGKYQCTYPGCYVGYKKPDDKKKKKKKKGGSKNSSEQQAVGDQEFQQPKGPPSVFSRPADLERHYLGVHSENRPEYPCDAPNCSRGEKYPFGRKDHLRDHLRDYHRQDVGCAKRDKKTNNISEEEIEAKWQRDQQIWIETRLISRRSWRCNKCLTKTWVANSGWTCSNQKCNQPCEEERIQARLNLLPGAEHTEEHHTEEPPQVVHNEQPQPKVVAHTEEPQPEVGHPADPFLWQSTAASDYCFQCGNSGSVYGGFSCGFCQASDESSNYNIGNYDYNMTLPQPFFTTPE